jgi:hypothetical protein
MALCEEHNCYNLGVKLDKLNPNKTGVILWIMMMTLYTVLKLEII